MRRALIVLSVLALALVAGSTAGFCYSSLGGPTGGAVLPDAMVAPAGSLELAVDYTKINSSSLAKMALGNAVGLYSDEFGFVTPAAGTLGLYSQDLTLIPVRVVYGVGKGAELWGAWTHIKGNGNTNQWGVGAKYQLMTEPKDKVTLAVGAGYSRVNDLEKLVSPSTVALADALGLYFTAPDDKLTMWNAYLVATKDLSNLAKEGMAWGGKDMRILGSLGVMYAKYSDIIDESVFEPFVSVEFSSGKGTALNLEYRFKDSSVDQKGLFSAVLRHPFTKNLSAQVGVTNGAFMGLGGNDFDVFGGISYTFGFGKSEEGGY